MSEQKSLWNFIHYFIKKQKYYFIAIQILALAWSLDNTVWPYAIGWMVDKLLAFGGDKTDIWIYLLPVLAFWLGLWLTVDIMFRIQGFIMAKVFPQFEADIRMHMFNYVEKHSYDFFASHFAGNLSNKISDMTQSATRVLQLIMTLFAPALAALVIATGIFYSINHFFAFLLGGWAILHIAICLSGAKNCSHLSDVHSTSRSFLTGKVVDTFTNIINVKLFARHQFESCYIDGYQQDEKAKNRAVLISIEKLKILLSISSIIFPGIMMTWYEIYSWQHELITMGDLVLIINTTWNIMLLAWIAGLELPNLFKEIGICQQALGIMNVQHDITDKPDATKLNVKQGEIVFDKVNFHYMKENRIFEDISVTLQAGSKVGLVGFSGSGKTTFVNLIMRFFEIESGTIFIDDQNINHVTLNSLRGQVSMIPQNPSLFHRSLLDNIRYGKLDATDDEILDAAKHAHCDEFINQLSARYDTLVGERGIKLSGGQRQRIAIARAILKDSPILILDEATSALDSVTEKHIQGALQFLMQNRTTLVVAHRLSTLAEMDRILVFDHGKIIEDGNHEQLLKTHGHYATMWHMQAGGFLPDQPITSDQG